MSRLYKDGLRLRLVLNKRERKTLTHILNRSDKPYQRERAAAKKEKFHHKKHYGITFSFRKRKSLIHSLISPSPNDVQFQKPRRFG